LTLIQHAAGNPIFFGDFSEAIYLASVSAVRQYFSKKREPWRTPVFVSANNLVADIYT
jgi:hypothetical protein